MPRRFYIFIILNSIQLNKSMSELGLSNINILSQHEAGDRLHFVVESICTSICFYCQSGSLHKWTAKKDQRFVDIPACGMPTVIWMNRKRWRCVECGKTFLEHLEWIDSKHRMTKRLVEYIKKEAKERTLASVAREIGVDPMTIKHVCR